MKVMYDPDHDILNIEFLEDETIDDTIEYDEVILIDYSKERKIVSLEILDASEKISHSPTDLLNFVVLDKSKKQALV
ncbi:MAG: DUF2283 domain-containing protein [Candidatus Saliniplasma sp.]